MTDRSTLSNREPKIVVVGSCASGKSTVVTALRAAGYDAYVCAQEHSEVRTLWRHGDPDFVVLLEADLAVVRDRRDEHWPESIYRAQGRRLKEARAAANVIIDTGLVSIEDAVNRVSAAVAKLVMKPTPSERAGDD